MQDALRYLKGKRPALGIVFLFCFSLICFRWFCIPMPENVYPPRTGVYGDVWSCLNVQSAATYFRDHGFAKSSGLPVFNYTGIGSEDHTFVYTHYPPLPDELAGITAVVTGSTDTRVLSILPVLLSLVFFGLIFLALQMYCAIDRPAAMAAGILTVISCYFVSWADDFHQHVYGEFCKWLYVLLLYLYYLKKEKRAALLAGASFLALVNTWITFEHILYYGIVTAGFSLIFQRRPFTWTNVLLLAMPLLGLALHVLQNYSYFGNWDLVWKDITGAYVERTVGHEGTVTIGAKEIRELPDKVFFRFTREFFIGTEPFIAIALLGFVHLWRTRRRHFWIGITLFLASASWIVFMKQHTYIHLFTVRHFGLFYAFMLAFGIHAGIHYFKMIRARHARLAIVIAICAVMLALIPAINSHFNYMYLKFGFAYPHLGLEHHLYD